MNLTADQITVDGSTAYVVAEGETYQPFHREWKVRPDAWMTATCETCDGRGWSLNGPNYHDPSEHLKCVLCPDCLNGKPIHTFDVECPHDCRRFGGKVPGHIRGSGWDWVPCWCNGTFTVSYRLAVREVLHMRAGLQSSLDPPTGSWAAQLPDGRWVRQDCDGIGITTTPGLTLPPAAKPGMYLAICEVLP